MSAMRNNAHPLAVGIPAKLENQLSVGCAMRTVKLKGAHSAPYKGKA